MNGSTALERARAQNVAESRADVTALDEARAIAQRPELDLEQYRQAWSLTDVADAEGAAVHLVSEVRIALLERLRSQVAEEFELAAAVPASERRDALHRVHALAVFFVQAIGREWERTKRLVDPLITLIELEIGGVPPSIGDA